MTMDIQDKAMGCLSGSQFYLFFTTINDQVQEVQYFRTSF